VHRAGKQYTANMTDSDICHAQQTCSHKHNSALGTYLRKQNVSNLREFSIQTMSIVSYRRITLNTYSATAASSSLLPGDDLRRIFRLCFDFLDFYNKINTFQNATSNNIIDV